MPVTLYHIAEAASAYGNALSASSPSIGTTSNSNNSLIYQPSNVNLSRVTPIPITPISANPPKPQAPLRLQALQNISQQLNAGINPVRTTRINLLSALTQGAEYPTHSQPSATNAQPSPIQLPQGSLLPPQSRNAGSTAPHRTQEQPYHIQGAQQPVSYASLYDVNQSQAGPIFNLRASIGSPQWQSQQSILPSQQMISPLMLNHAFSEPKKSKPDIVQQAKQGRLDDSRLGQVELNLDILKSGKQITKEQYHSLESIAKAMFASNWLKHDSQEDPDGTMTYRGIKIDKKLAPLLAYTDATHYWETDKHIHPQNN